MASFQDLGLREPLLRALEDEGLERPTGLQQAAIPVLRREGNLVARASSGAGKTLAYGLGVLDRLQPRTPPADEAEGEEAAAGPRMLVLAATPEAAERAALELVPYAQAVELTVAASGGGWGTPTGEADVLVATPGEVMEAVRTSSVKLEAVEAVVIDGASEVEALAGWEALETLFDHVPRDAQRVVVTAAVSDAVEDLVSRRVKRALRYPAEAASPDRFAPEPEQAGVVGYVAVGGRDRVDVVARLLGGGAPAPVLYCRTDERAAQLAEALAQRGFLVGEPGDDDADVAVVGSDDAEAAGSGGTAISYDVPADEDTLKVRHAGGEAGFVLVEPRELAHLREIAKRAAFAAQPAGVSGDEPRGAAELRAFRGELRRALREEDLAAQMLLLEPLFEDFTPAEVAAAASALLRKRRPEAPASTPAPGAAPAAGAGAAARPGRMLRTERPGPSEAPAPTGAPAPFTRLFISLGERDGVRANDLVGAIAGEAEITGKQIGKIEIRDTFSIVEVPADAAERVIGALNGTTIRNRSVRVDYDRQRTGAGPRGGAGGPRSGPGGPRGPRPGGVRPGGARPGGARPGGPRPGGGRPGGSRPPQGGDSPRPPRRPRDE